MIGLNDVNAFTEGIGSAAYRLDYLDFCRILEWVPETDYSKAKWLQFKTLAADLSYFTPETLLKLIAAGAEAAARARSQPQPPLLPGSHPMSPRPKEGKRHDRCLPPLQK
jgi:hypothetical protein